MILSCRLLLEKLIEFKHMTKKINRYEFLNGKQFGERKKNNWCYVQNSVF